MPLDNNYRSEFLIIGSGIAGLSFALRVAQLGKVIVVTKKQDFESNTNYAQGGIASVINPVDSFDKHIQDTLYAGAGLCQEKVVEKIVQEGPTCIQDLINWGVEFTRDNTGNLELGREGGHSQRRIVHAADLTGKEIELALLQALRNNENVQLLENHIAIDLITQHHLTSRHVVSWGKINCWGAYVLDVNGDCVKKVIAKVTMLASGGTGQVYQHTSNPGIATGDGVCMAYRAGAEIANLEFVQFHPTTFYQPDSHERSFLISEAVRGEGAVLRTQDGKRFMDSYHAMAELAPRDIVARAIDNEMKKRGEPYVWLDITHQSADFLKKRFPTIYQHCQQHGIDIAKNYIPVVPAAHYMCGGVACNVNGQTAIQNLYVAGEVTHIGLHGANRLASNSLLEAVVVAKLAFEKIKSEDAYKANDIPEIPDWDDTGVVRSEETVLISHDRDSIKRLMWDYVGIVRSDRRLERARDRLFFLKKDITDFYRTTRLTADLIELRNLVYVADLIIRCALKRKESRGLHYNIDYPDRDDKNWLRDTVVRSAEL